MGNNEKAISFCRSGPEANGTVCVSIHKVPTAINRKYPRQEVVLHRSAVSVIAENAACLVD